MFLNLPSESDSISSKNKVGRPRKPGALLQAKSKNWRIVIPNLSDYKDSTRQQLLNLKYQVLTKILDREKNKDLQYYSVALQTHLDGTPHLDILLIYPKSILFKLNHFDYILKHGNVTTYKKLNAAILDYNNKQDLYRLSNLPQDCSKLINIQQLCKDPYRYLQLQMLKDPLHFNLEQYVRSHDLAHYISGWSSIKTKLKDMQVAAANLQLRQKPGFRYINKALIEEILNPDQLTLYYSWSGYQTIVNYLNQIITYGYKRPMKTMNLLITGKPNIGKTSFIEADLNNTRNCIQRYCSVYPMSAKTWWPNYRSEVYQLISWNEAKLTSYSYDTILKVLQGSKVDLPQKGSSTLKYDNPLVLMTSNMTLEQMIQQKFGYSEAYVNMARKNLAVRVQNVIVPKDYDLFLLQKLLIEK